MGAAGPTGIWSAHALSLICSARQDRQARVLGKAGIFERFEALHEYGAAVGADFADQTAVRTESARCRRFDGRHTTSMLRRLTPAAERAYNPSSLGNVCRIRALVAREQGVRHVSRNCRVALPFLRISSDRTGIPRHPHG